MLKRVTCNSNGYAYNECTLGGPSTILSVSKAKQLSSSSCNYFAGPVEDYTGGSGAYGYNNRFLWVHKGCRAEFDICAGNSMDGIF